VELLWSVGPLADLHFLKFICLLGYLSCDTNVNKCAVASSVLATSVLNQNPKWKP